MNVWNITHSAAVMRKNAPVKETAKRQFRKEVCFLAVKIKVFLYYTGFWIVFAAVFAMMFAMLAAAVMGVPFGLMMSVMGVAVLIFRADFVISELSPQLMVFAGLAGAFFAAFLGLLAVKMGYAVSRLFLRIKRRCDRLREW